MRRPVSSIRKYSKYMPIRKIHAEILAQNSEKKRNVAPG